MSNMYKFQDAWNLYYKLPEHIRHGIYEVKTVHFNHIDFIFGKYAREFVYDYIVEILNHLYHA